MIDARYREPLDAAAPARADPPRVCARCYTPLPCGQPTAFFLT